MVDWEALRALSLVEERWEALLGCGHSASRLGLIRGGDFEAIADAMARALYSFDEVEEEFVLEKGFARPCGHLMAEGQIFETIVVPEGYGRSGPLRDLLARCLQKECELGIPFTVLAPMEDGWEALTEHPFGHALDRARLIGQLNEAGHRPMALNADGLRLRHLKQNRFHLFAIENGGDDRPTGSICLTLHRFARPEWYPDMQADWIDLRDVQTTKLACKATEQGLEVRIPNMASGERAGLLIDTDPD